MSVTERERRGTGLAIVVAIVLLVSAAVVYGDGPAAGLTDRVKVSPVFDASYLRHQVRTLQSSKPEVRNTYIAAPQRRDPLSRAQRVASPPRHRTLPGIGGAFIGALLGFWAGGEIGAALDHCRCEENGLGGLMIGGVIGGAAGGVAGFMLASR
jgi:hypothetical protein